MPYKNKKDQAKASRKHYLANKEAIKRKALVFNRKARIRNKRYVSDYLRNHPCVDCGEDNIIVLEFDHRNGKKERNISDAINRAISTKNLQKEIDKCEVRCANCHRKRHFHERNTVQYPRTQAIK